MHSRTFKSSYGWLALLATMALAGTADAQQRPLRVRLLPNPGAVSAPPQEPIAAPNPPKASPDVKPLAKATVSPVTIGQAPGTQQTGLVSIKADGTDVHEVLKSLFGQAKKNYVLEPGIHFALYLSLEGVEFDEALGIVCHLAKLKNELRDGIYYVGPDNGDVKPTGKPIELTPPVKPAKPAKPTQTGPVSKPKVASAGSLTSGALYKKRVNVRFAKTDIRSVFSELGRQGQVTIVVDKSVPNYKLDVVLRHTSLLYAMQRITKAAGLTFGVENGQIKVVGKASATTASGKTASNPS